MSLEFLCQKSFTTVTDDEPVPAASAVATMQIIEDVEMKTLLGFPVVTKAEPYVPPPSRWTAPVDGAAGLGSVGSGGGQTSLLIAGLHTYACFYSSHSTAVRA